MKNQTNSKPQTKRAILNALDTFTRSYLEAALWSSTDNSTPSGGEPLDRNYDIRDFTLKTLEESIGDCNDFRQANEKDLELADMSDDRAGHNFWLNRNRHGSGFWDEYSQTTCEKYNQEQKIAVETRDFSKREALKETCNCPYHACQRLSDASKIYGGVDLTVYRGKVTL